MPMDFSRLFAATQQLMAIDSTTGNEAAAGAWLAERLEHAGYAVTKQEVAPNRFNVYATKGTPRVTLTTHMDCVPPFIPPTETDTHHIGRGACDAKGIIAAMLEAGQLLTCAHGLLFVVGEETDSIGAKAFTRSGLGAGTRYMIDGEPTENRLMRGHKGVLAFSASRKGSTGHSAYPELFDSALHKLVQELNTLLTKTLPSDANYGTTTVNIGLLQGGRAPNVVADEAKADVVCRLARPLKEVEPLILGAFAKDTTIDVKTKSDPSEMFVPEGYASDIVRFGTDVPHLRPICPVLLVGPGTIHDAHTEHERLSKDDQVKAVNLYVELVEKLHG